MKIPKKKKTVPEIPQSSLSDMSFLLLVFFLSTTKFDVKKGMGLVLPPPSSAADQKVKLKDENLAKILVSQDGQIVLNQEYIALQSLEGTIKQMVTANPDLVISLKTDRKSKYEYMIKVLDKLRLAGATKIALSTN